MFRAAFRRRRPQFFKKISNFLTNFPANFLTRLSSWTFSTNFSTKLFSQTFQRNFPAEFFLEATRLWIRLLTLIQIKLQPNLISLLNLICSLIQCLWSFRWSFRMKFDGEEIWSESSSCNFAGTWRVWVVSDWVLSEYSWGSLSRTEASAGCHLRLWNAFVDWLPVARQVRSLQDKRSASLPTETIPFSWQIQFALINLVSSLVSSLVNLLINLLVASSCSSPVGRLFAVIHGLTSLFTGLLTDFSAGFLTSFTGLFTSLFTGLLAKMLEISLDNLTG